MAQPWSYGTVVVFGSMYTNRCTPHIRTTLSPHPGSAAQTADGASYCAGCHRLPSAATPSRAWSTRIMPGSCLTRIEYPDVESAQCHHAIPSNAANAAGPSMSNMELTLQYTVRLGADQPPIAATLAARLRGRPIRRSRLRPGFERHRPRSGGGGGGGRDGP